ncbi:hypothetical protein LMZ02_04740 [Paenibacillus macerans]|nr:hypothetical protein [Paenibacillus macerans]MEC0331787.1 hypothetical protein [Paenibacillus macerans]UMV48704.1 hypothetical protein LMZ02_04740 [Paenibacillus macerans]GBK68477.1 hypothetical protein PbJCM17693_21850 [Paenibacillus macerans]
MKIKKRSLANILDSHRTEKGEIALQLSDSTYSEITALCKQGDDLVKAGDLDAGKQKYIAALRLLPENHREVVL